MEHQRCYVYEPSAIGERAPKRRRIASAVSTSQRSLREHTYRELWSVQEAKIKETLEAADKSTLEQITNFVSNAHIIPNEAWQSIPTGLIVVGPSIASHGSFFERLGRNITANEDSTFVVLTSNECPNLKTLLKNLIKKATSRLEEEDADEEISNSTRSGPKLLDFDLGLLQQWHAKTRTQKIVVAIQDSEAFDAHLLAETIETFHTWLDRLPFVLLFGIATSSESFEERLSGFALRYVEGEKFIVTQAEEIVEKLFIATVSHPDISLRIGPNLSRRILDRQKDHVQSVQDFSDGLKYAYMSHFYANDLSVFLKSHPDFDSIPKDIFEAARNLSSFRKHVEAMLDDGHTKEVRQLLDSNLFLFEDMLDHMETGKAALSDLSLAAIVLSTVRESLQLTPQLPQSSIWIRAASGELNGSLLVRETLLSIKKTSSDKLVELLKSLASGFPHLTPQLSQYQQALNELLEKNTTSTSLRSQHDIRANSLRTTVVAQKVELSKQKAALSDQDKLYSDLIDRIHADMEGYFNQALIDPRDLFLSEILIYDLRSPHSEVFNPRPRFAIERALASPHDYLNCDCCGDSRGRDEHGALSGTQPATAVLYQLYLESGSLINVSDLWAAFNAIFGEEDEDSESTTMALFQRALAELKFLGFVKLSKKKTDHISKMMWRGL